MSDGVTSALPVADPRDAERRLWEAFWHGVLVDLRSGDPGVDDPAHADRRDASRRVRAEVVTALPFGLLAPRLAPMAGTLPVGQVG